MFFGAHVSTAGGIYKSVERAAAIGADAVQLFTQSPRMWKPTLHSDENVARFRELMVEHQMQGSVAHAIYLINIASPDDELHDKSELALVNTMKTAERLKLDAVIFHPGSHKGEASRLDGCIDRMAKSIAATLEESTDTWLLLENSAGQGGTIGRDLPELARLIALVDHPRLGICIDTCHWYVSGVDVTDRAVLDAHLDELDATIGMEKLRALHVNDSKAPLGSNLDRHENIGEGLMGDGLATFLTHPRLQGLGAYLETPGDGDGPTDTQIARVRALARART